MALLLKLCVLPILFVFCIFAPASANMQHAEKKQSGRCSYVNQAASIQCASAPSSVFDNNGRLWSAWAYSGHIYVNYSDDQGKSFSQPRVVNRSPEAIAVRGENRPKIKLDNEGNIFVSWTTPLEKRFTGHVRFSYSSDAGVNFSEPVIVNNNLEVTGHRFDALGVNSQGDIYIAWLDKRDRLLHERKGEKYHGAALYYSWSGDSGKTFKKDKKIIDHSCECCRVIIDFDEKDLPVILWRNIYGKNTRDHALVRFQNKTTPFEPQRVSHDLWEIDACPHHGPDMSINDNGDIHLVWFNNAAERHGLFYARRNQSTGLLTKAVSFGDYSKAAQHASIAHYKQKVWLAWKQFDGIRESIWIQTSEDNGDTWKKSIKISSTKKSSDYPFLLMNKGKAYIQWNTEAEGFQLIGVN